MTIPILQRSWVLGAVLLFLCPLLTSAQTPAQIPQIEAAFDQNLPHFSFRERTLGSRVPPRTDPARDDHTQQSDCVPPIPYARQINQPQIEKWLQHWRQGILEGQPVPQDDLKQLDQLLETAPNLTALDCIKIGWGVRFVETPDDGVTFHFYRAGVYHAEKELAAKSESKQQILDGLMSIFGPSWDIHYAKNHDFDFPAIMLWCQLLRDYSPPDSPDSRKARVLYNEALWHQRKFLEAAHDVEKILVEWGDQAPDHDRADLQWLAGNCYYNAYRYKEALPHLQIAAKLSPDYLNLGQDWIANCLLWTGQKSAADKIYASMIDEGKMSLDDAIRIAIMYEQGKQAAQTP